MARTAITNQFAVRNANGSLFSGGGTDNVSLGAATDFDWERTQAWSFSMWSMTTPDVSTQKTLFAKQQNSGEFIGYALAIIATTHQYRVFIRSTSASLIQLTSVVRATPNMWKHIVCTYDGSSTAAGVKLYINTDSKTLTVNNDTLTTSIDNGVLTRLGSRDGGANPYKGYMADVAVYDSVLTQAQINDIYWNNKFPVSPYARFTFSDGSGGTLTDSSGNARHGTINGLDWTTLKPFGLRNNSTARSASAARTAV